MEILPEIRYFDLKTKLNIEGRFITDGSTLGRPQVQESQS